MKKIIVLIFILFFSFLNIVYAYEGSVVDITKMDIVSIQNAIDKGYLSYEKLIKLYIDRIDEYEDKYNAIISINENAIEEAKECDKEYKLNGRKSMLFCIPIIIKDNIDYIGLPTTAGSKALKDSIPYTNSIIVENMISDGVIILGKANMSEFAFSARDSRSSYGSVKNAYNVEYSPYGSSGGSASSVALSFSTASLGTDTNSSIRLPASAANLVGLRPTQGLLSNKGIIAYDVTRDTAGPITKTVTDSAILLTSMANNSIDYTKYLKIDGLNEKKIGLITEFLDDSYNQISDMFDKVILDMKNNGATIIDIDSFYTNTVKNYNSSTIYGRSMSYEFNKYILNTSSNIKSFDQLVKNGGYIQALSGYNIYGNQNLLLSNDYKEKEKLKQKYRDYVEEIMDKYDVDVLIYPTTSSKLIKVSEINTGRVINNSFKISPPTGCPSITVPMGFDSNELPYGFELLSKPNKENLLFEIAYAYEQIDKKLITPQKGAPTLYMIGEVIDELKTIYEKNIGLDKELDKQAKTYFLEYENTDISNEKAYDLITKYEELENKIILENKLNEERAIIGKIIQTIIIIVIIILILLTLFINIKYNIKLKKRKH